jgi:hypothetical protein
MRVNGLYPTPNLVVRTMCFIVHHLTIFARRHRSSSRHLIILSPSHHRLYYLFLFSFHHHLTIFARRHRSSSRHLIILSPSHHPLAISSSSRHLIILSPSHHPLAISSSSHHSCMSSSIILSSSHFILPSVTVCAGVLDVNVLCFAE